MKDAKDAEQGSKGVLEITPCIPLILRGMKQTVSILSFPLLKLFRNVVAQFIGSLPSSLRGCPSQPKQSRGVLDCRAPFRCSQ
jgi:hypothetical protein